MSELAEPVPAEVATAWRTIAEAPLPHLALRHWHGLLMLLVVGKRIPLADILPRRAFRKAGHILPPRPEPTRAAIAALARKADLLANSHARDHRAGYVGRFLLSALVGLVALYVLHSHPTMQSLVFGLQLGAMLLIMTSVLGARRRGTFDRWLDLRGVSQTLETLLALPEANMDEAAMNGADGPKSAKANAALVDWCARVLASEPALAEPLHARLSASVEAQIDYHRSTAAALATAERRLAKVGLVCLYGGLVLGVAAFLASLAADDWLAAHGPAVALVLAILPTISGALRGIRSQASFTYEAERAERTAHRLERLCAEIDPNDAAATLERARRFARLQDEQFMLWHEVQRGRALDLPGG